MKFFLYAEIIDQKVKEVMTILEIDEFEAALPFVNLKYPKICQIAFVWKKEAELEPALQNKNNNIRSRLQFLAFTLEVCYLYILYWRTFDNRLKCYYNVNVLVNSALGQQM